MLKFVVSRLMQSLGASAQPKWHSGTINIRKIERSPLEPDADEQQRSAVLGYHSLRIKGRCSTLCKTMRFGVLPPITDRSGKLNFKFNQHTICSCSASTLYRRKRDTGRLVAVIITIAMDCSKLKNTSGGMTCIPEDRIAAVMDLVRGWHQLNKLFVVKRSLGIYQYPCPYKSLN